MKDMMIDMMVAMMPYMKPVMWVGIIMAVIGLVFILANIFLKMDLQKSIVWSGRIALATAIFFIAAQIAGYFLNMPPSVNFGDSSKFEFILVSFWQISLGLFIPSLIIIYLPKSQLSSSTAT